MQLTKNIRISFQIFVEEVFSAADDEDVDTKNCLCVTIVNEN